MTRDDSWLKNTREPAANNLLRSLSADDFALLAPHLSPWSGRCTDLIYEPGQTVRHVYFPCGPSLISYMVVFEDGRSIETALVGREGAVGGVVSQGRLPAYAKAEVQYPGPFLRIDIERMEIAKSQSLTLRHLFTRYADCMMAQVFQAVACNAAHTIEQRAAKWLLSAMDRTGAPQVPLTQEQLANMLGVGRSYISRVLANFKRRNIISTGRGSLIVTDLARLQAIACPCNDSVKKHFDEVLRGVYPEAEVDAA